MTPFHTLEALLTSDAPDEELCTLRAAGWLKRHLPEIDRLYGVPQNPLHHPEIDTGRHVELVLQVAATLSAAPQVRYAALVHDIGKGLTPESHWPRHINHEALGVKPGVRMGLRLGVPKSWRHLGALVARFHLRSHRVQGESARHLVRFFRDAGFFEHPALLEPFLLACEADARGRAGLQNRPYPQATILRNAFKAAREVPVDLPLAVVHSARIAAVAKALPTLLTGCAVDCE